MEANWRRYCRLLTSNCRVFSKNRWRASLTNKFPSPDPSVFVRLNRFDNGRNYKTMKVTLPNEMGSARRLRTSEPAQVRIVVLTLVSFLLGVAATALWFHLTPHRDAEILNSRTTDQQNNQQPAQSADAANPSARAFVEQPVPVAPAALEDVKRVLPNYAAISVDEGTEILRQVTLKKYAAAAQELQSQVAEAEKELQLAQSKSPADQQAAIGHLQQVQAEQSQKLQLIAGQLQTQIAALKQLKGTTP